MFVRDTATGTIARVSVDSKDIQADKLSSHAAISADGRYVAFASSATNLVPGDTNGEHDVFVHDTVGGLTARVSVSSTGAQGNLSSGGPSITADGRYIAFWTESSTLVADDDNGVYDAFVRDTATAATARVSVDSNGAQGDEESTHPAISADGRFVAFTSLAANLVPDDTNGLEDVFRHQLLPDPPPPTTTTTTTILPGGDDAFVDDDNSVFESDIEALARAGITKGCNPPVNDRFCPDDSVTRGQMAAFLVRALGYTDDGGGDRFIDDDLSVFEADIDRLGTAGVTKGCNPPVNDWFCPDDSVTRGQMAAFLVRALGYAGGRSDLFTDDDLSVFEADIDRLGAAGVTKGCNPPVNDRFCPTEVVTRGQMAAFLTRALDLD